MRTRHDPTTLYGGASALSLSLSLTPPGSSSAPLIFLLGYPRQMRCATPSLDSARVGQCHRCVALVLLQPTPFHSTQQKPLIITIIVFSLFAASIPPAVRPPQNNVSQVDFRIAPAAGAGSLLPSFPLLEWALVSRQRRGHTHLALLRELRPKQAP